MSPRPGKACESGERDGGLISRQGKDQELTTGFDLMEGMADFDKSS